MSTTNGATTTTTAMGLVKAEARTAIHAFEPGSLDEGWRLAKMLVASRLLPRAVATPEAALAIMLTGRELGLTAMQALRSIHVIEGKPTLSADLQVALVKRNPACKFFRLVESTGERATYETQRIGEPSPTRMSFTIEEARSAGLTGKDNWKKYPSAMLRARCIAALARAVYPDALMGVYDPDELGAVTDDRGEIVEMRSAATVAPVVAATEAAQLDSPDEYGPDADALLDAAQGLMEQIHACTTADELRALRNAVMATPEAFRAPVREDYNAKNKSLKSPAAPDSEAAQ